MLTPDEILLVVILIVLFILLFATRLKIEIIALIMLLSVSFGGLVESDRALSGFGSSVVITLIGLFIITHALEETGVIHWIANKLNLIGQGSESKLISLFMLAGASLSLIMNNVAAGAVLLPAAVNVANLSNVRVSKLLMPLSFGTLVGGMATYLTTANIIMSELLLKNGDEGLHMVDFLKTGTLIVVAGLLYMLLIGRRLLPDRQSRSKALMQPNLQNTYRLDERIWRIRVGEQSRIANQALQTSGIGELLGITVLAIKHRGHVINTPDPHQMIHASDVMLVMGHKERIDALLAWGNDLLDAPHANGNGNHDLHLNLTEVIVAPRSAVVGQTLTQLHFREKFSASVIAIWKHGHSLRTDVGKRTLEAGDALLTVGHADGIKALADDKNYIVPDSGYAALPHRPEKAPIAILITAIVLVIAMFGWLPLPQMMLAGAVAMVITGCLTIDEFHHAVEWRVVFLVAGMLPLSIAMTDTGLAGRVGVLLVDLLIDYNPLVLVGGMIILTMLIVQIIGGQVTPLLIGPIALDAAQQAGVNPQAMAVAVAMACSMAFLTPIAHPVNMLMMGPGAYQFRDFLKVGAGLTIVTLCTMLLGMNLIWHVG